MYSVLCPHCHFVNPAGATCCRACNADFFVDSDQGDLELDPAVTASLKQRRGLSSLLTEAMDTAAPPPRRRASDLEPTHDDSPTPVAADAVPMAALTLIEPQTPPEPPAGRSALDVSLAAPPNWPELAPSAEATLAVPAPLATPALPAPRDAPEPDRRTVTKAMARQAARRARMAALMSDATTPPPVDVLVLDGDDATRAELVRLLGRFGFHVHEALDLGQAEQLAEVGPFAAAFLDIRLDDSEGGAGVALCERLHRPVRGGAATAIVLMSPRLRPADRVRAALARSDALLAKPLSRGDVARTLESCGVALPADERRH